MAVEAGAPCGDCNNNNNNNNKVISIVTLIKIITDEKLDAGAFSSEKGKGGLGGSRMGTKENNNAKARRPCSWECYEKNETYCYSEMFFS
jgi:hypothetical protein